MTELPQTSDPALWQIAEALSGWAESVDIIECIWFFGSRIKGGYRADSDLDVAIGLSSTGYEGLADFWAEDDDWRAQVSFLSPYLIDLQYLDAEITPNMVDHVRDSGWLVFQRTDCDCAARFAQ
jgi:hypothetical protein